MAVTSRNTFSLHSIGTSNKCNHFSVMVLWLATPTHRFKCAGLVVRCAVGLALASTHASRHNIRDAIFIFTCDVDGFLPVFQPTMTTAFDTVDSENDEKYSSEQRSPHLVKEGLRITKAPHRGLAVRYSATHETIYWRSKFPRSEKPIS